MHPLAETLLDEPVIAAVKTDDALTAALASPCSTVFLLASTLLNVGELVRRIHAAGKLAVVHIDLVDGLSAREVAVNSLIALCHPDGIISTHPSLIRRARHQGLLTIQRAFILDSLSLNNLSGQLVHIFTDLGMLNHDNDHIDICEKSVKIMVLVLDHILGDERIIDLQSGCQMTLLALQQLQRRRLTHIIDILFIGQTI